MHLSKDILYPLSLSSHISAVFLLNPPNMTGTPNKRQDLEGIYTVLLTSAVFEKSKPRASDSSSLCFPVLFLTLDRMAGIPVENCSAKKQHRC